ncbi:MAG: hypothetical protein H7Y38_11940 [Armatimonadetes bacterium]|nr:hypothetical protein [Armatimonadota bacterium]
MTCISKWLRAATFRSRPCRLPRLRNKSVRLSALVAVHVVAGIICLGAGAVAAFVKPKGGRRHVSSGRVFLYALAVSAITAGVLLCFRFQPFFFALSVLSFYFGFSGYRVLARNGNAAHFTDWFAAGGVVAVTTLSLWWGATGVLGADAGIVLGVLGLAVVAALYDLWRFAFPRVVIPMRSLSTFEHLTKIGGAYIAVWCAFSANVGTGVWSQIAPALIGTPLLLIVANRYWRKWRHGTATAPTSGKASSGAIE